MKETKSVRITNFPMGIFSRIAVLCCVLMFIQSCTDDCNGTENFIQCGGYIAKQIKIDFDKGYSYEKVKETK